MSDSDSPPQRRPPRRARLARPRLLVACAGLLLLGLAAPPDAAAGMPALTLTELARLRLDAISFFLVVLLLAAWGVKALWNSLRRDFTRLPRLSYGRALALVLAWGLAFNLVLTMIAGARELMTPGAWERDGVTYHLREAPAAPAGAQG